MKVSAGTPSPLEPAQPSIAGGRRIFLKREDLHELGSFKWRGALPSVEKYRGEGAAGVMTASTGNHGAATAWAARRCGIPATIYAPVGASRHKVARMEAMGGEVRLAGRDLDETKDLARIDASLRGWPFFEDGADAAQLAGYGRIAGEILDHMEGAPGSVVVPVGNGALIGGVGLVLRQRAPGVRVVAAIAKSAPVMALSWREGRAVPCFEMATFADGLAVRVAIPEAVELMLRVVDRVELVSEREIADGVRLYAAAGIRAEGAAGAGLAVASRATDLPEPVVVLVTGRNIDEDVHRRALESPESFSG